MADDLTVIEQTLGLDTDQAAEVLELTHWADHQAAIARWGYPKDNAIPAPMARRLADPEYLALLVEAARDQDAPPEVVAALERRLAAASGA